MTELGVSCAIIATLVPLSTVKAYASTHAWIKQTSCHYAYMIVLKGIIVIAIDDITLLVWNGHSKQRKVSHLCGQDKEYTVDVKCVKW